MNESSGIIGRKGVYNSYQEYYQHELKDANSSTYVEDNTYDALVLGVLFVVCFVAYYTPRVIIYIISKIFFIKNTHLQCFYH